VRRLLPSLPHPVPFPLAEQRPVPSSDTATSPVERVSATRQLPLGGLTAGGFPWAGAPIFLACAAASCPTPPLSDLVRQPRPTCVDHPESMPAPGARWALHGQHVLISSRSAPNPVHAALLCRCCWLSLWALIGLARPSLRRDKGPNCPATNGACHNTFVSSTQFGAGCA